MRFIPVITERQFQVAQEFVSKYEEFSVTLADKIRMRERHLYIVAEGASLNNSVSNFIFGNSIVSALTTAQNMPRIHGVIYAFNTLHASIPFIFDQNLYDKKVAQDFVSSLYNFLLNKNINCISATDELVQIFVSVFNQMGAQVKHRNEYFLMTHSQNVEFDFPATIQISSIAPKECDELFPLQKNYIVEEVLPPCRTFNAAASRMEFLNLLKTRTEICARVHGSPAAKGGIHSEGEHTAQFGGIYTLVEHRSHHYARAVVARLIQIAHDQKKQPTLFVRKENIPAITTYSKLGFQNIGNWTIVYY